MVDLVYGGLVVSQRIGNVLSKNLNLLWLFPNENLLTFYNTRFFIRINFIISG